MNNEEMTNRKLMMVAAALGQNIGDLWDVYQELFRRVDLDNPETSSLMWELLAEMEANLVDMLDQVGGQIYLLTGVYEPVPYEKVDDFEASVLRDIGSLGEVDLEKYRMEIDRE